MNPENRDEPTVTLHDLDLSHLLPYALADTDRQDSEESDDFKESAVPISLDQMLAELGMTQEELKGMCESKTHVAN